jgi:hypothetical protein
MFGTLANRLIDRTGFRSGYMPKGRQNDDPNVAQTHLCVAVVPLKSTT